MRGEQVHVIRREITGVDAGNAPVYADGIIEPVDNVLVAPASTADATDGNRPDGITVNLTLAFPRDYASSLHGCDVIIRGERYRVVGDPIPVDGGLTPTAWNRRVTVYRSEG